MPFLIVVGSSSHQEKATWKPQIQQEESTLLCSLRFINKKDDRERARLKKSKKDLSSPDESSQGNQALMT
ncbi:hypothetical protein TNIN_196971 [Trichonephila inaurata madagascariensis]|uniref:Uncharacterized protein n=1 Tax=Trichonephila inaurata madagascariensis TaxID=2747483 RepID=A0A8X7C2U4_9ARAC|nr:hypothetical protein TNIN_196971 [Trichonephila inaurata madagascariensis]